MPSSRSIYSFHGSVINAGDFLIQDSARTILNKLFPTSNIFESSRHKRLLHHEDALGVYFGGPFISRDLFPSVIPSQAILALPVGVGIFNETSVFTTETREYFHKISNFYPTGRDLRATQFLVELGCSNAELGGCPAFIAGLFKKRHEIKDVARIVVSDPSWGVNYSYAYKLVRILRRLFKSAEITFCFHRTIFNMQYKSFKASTAALALVSLFHAIGVKVCDISGSSDGFSIYNGALHVGFRVHAHVYARSIGGSSVLLTEDLRSLGMNDLFGEQIIEPRAIESDLIKLAIAHELNRKDKFFSLQQELFEVTQSALIRNHELT
ncbi:polysaccharide pyruvyl transferase family protein [Gammaproteobacteria bacterium]|nr:polysaccharide pyruvyl transferase family protein [Gammaproteobacteria bacterium]